MKWLLYNTEAGPTNGGRSNAYTYSELVAGGVTSDGEYYQYLGQQVWSPSPGLAAERVEFAVENGLQHVIIWEIGQDLPASQEASLLRSTFAAREDLVGLAGDFNRDGTVDAADYSVWRDGLGSLFTQEDYDIWAANYGTTAAATSLAVPEPAAGLLVVLVGTLAWRIPRSRTRSDVNLRPAGAASMQLT